MNCTIMMNCTCEKYYLNIIVDVDLTLWANEANALHDKTCYMLSTLHGICDGRADLFPNIVY